MTRIPWWAWLGGVLLVLCVVVKVSYHGPPPESVDLPEVDGKALLEQYAADPAGADRRYLQKPIVVVTTVETVERYGQTLEITQHWKGQTLVCQFEGNAGRMAADDVKIGSVVTLRGMCYGVSDKAARVNKCSVRGVSR